MSTIRLIVVVGVVTIFNANAQAKSKKLEIGAEAPTWKLAGTDGKEHGTSSLSDALAVVVIFTCDTCPVAKAYQERLLKLTAAYQDRKVAFVAINSNKGVDLADMKKFAEEQKLPFAYLRDDSQEVAKSFGAESTPEVFVLDKENKLAYRGAIDDDRRLNGKPRTHYLKAAIDAVLAGKEPATRSTKPFGCRIMWK